MNRRKLIAALGAALVGTAGLAGLANTGGGPPLIPPGLLKKTPSPTPPVPSTSTVGPLISTATPTDTPVASVTDTPQATVSPTGTPTLTPTPEATATVPMTRTVFMSPTPLLVPGSALTDNFDDNSMNTTLWSLGTLEGTFDTQVLVNEASQQLQITPRSSLVGSAYNGYLSVSTYDLTGSYVYVHVVQPASNNDTELSIGPNPTSLLHFDSANGVLVAEYTITGGAPWVTLRNDTPFSASVSWWRIREQSGTIFWDTSADSVTWSNYASAANPFAVTAVHVNIMAGTFQSILSPGMAIFDNLNVPAPPVTTFTLTPIPLSATEIANPWRGEIDWFGQVVPVGWPVRDNTIRIPWYLIENGSQGVYDFSSIDSGNSLDVAAANGGRFGFGVNCIDASAFQSLAGPVNTTMPSYLVTQDHGWSTTVNGVANFHVPDWNNATFLSRWSALWTAIGNHYTTAQKKRFGWIEVRCFGTFGEWDNVGAGPGGQAAFPTSASWDTIIGAVTSAFPNAFIVGHPDYSTDPGMTYPVGKLVGSSSTVPKGGWRCDGWGHARMAGAGSEIQNSIVPGIQTAWQSHFITGEWFDAVAASGVTEALNEAQVFHISALSSGGGGATSQANNPTDWATLMKSIGYRIQLDSATVLGTITRTVAFSMTTFWENVGNAPFYAGWPVNVILQATPGGAAVWTGVSTMNLATLLPTQQNHIDRIAVGFNAGSGSFTLTMAEGTTGSIAFNASAATVQSAIAALPGMSGNVIVTNDNVNAFGGLGCHVIFTGAKGNSPRTLMTVTNNTVAGDTVAATAWQTGIAAHTVSQVDTFTVPGSVAPGTYTLAVIVPDADGIGVPLQLANSGKQSDGSYALGTVTVV